MPTYPTNYYGPGITTNYNNVVTRRLAVKDRIAWGTSARFGGQYLEPKNSRTPYGGTIMDTVAACQQLINEFNLISPVLPDMGTPVILSSVGVATNIFRDFTGANGIAASYIGGITTNILISSTAKIDNVGVSTGLRVLYYGLSTNTLNGVYTMTLNSSGNFVLNRSFDLQYWWQFVKPKAYVVTNGTANKGNVFSLQTDAWEVGQPFTVALGTSVVTPSGVSFTTSGSAVTLSLTDYNPLNPSLINASTLGANGAGNTSLIYPPYNPTTWLNTGEYDFLAQASEQKFMYLQKRARRLAYQVFKMRENYTPFVSSYQTDVVTQIGLGNSQYNIGVSTLNNLPPQSRYPSSFNRGF